jgi:hypothetical protein
MEMAGPLLTTDCFCHVELAGSSSFQKTGDKRKAKGRKVDTDNRKNLQNIRVVQRNLVYVTNLSLDVAKEEVRSIEQLMSINSPMER